MMARAARFHANQTGLKIAEERRHLPTTQGLADNDLSRFINPMNLKNVLRQINANGRNLHNGWLLLLVVFDGNHTLAL
jgi:hypothetical protein